MSTVLEPTWTPVSARAGSAVIEREAYGTDIRVAVAEPEGINAARHAVDSVLHRLALIAGRHGDETEVSRLNASTGGGTFLLAQGLRELLELALATARWTDGLVDPVRRDDRLSGRTQEGLPMATWRSVRLSGALLEIDPGVVLDLEATARPLAADQGAHLAWARSGCQALVSVDTDVALTPDSRGGPWPIAIGESGERSSQASQIVLLARGGLATAVGAAGGTPSRSPSSHRRALRSELRFATVAAASCVEAKAAALAAIAAGKLGAHAWLESTGLPAQLVDAEGVITRLGGWPTRDGEALPLVNHLHLDSA